MKKVIVLLAAALMAGSAAFAQSKGDMYVGGGLTLGVGTSSAKITVAGTSSSDKTPVPTTFTIAPSFGYFVADNLRVGASLSLGLESLTNKSGETKYTESTTTFLVGPEVAYYLRLADNLYYTPELGIYGGVTASAEKYGTTKESTNMGTFALGLSLAQIEFRPTPKLGFGLDIMNLQYVLASKSEEMEGIKYKASVGAFNFNINATLSVKYYF